MAFCRTPCEPAVANAATGRDSQGARATFWILAATILGSSLSFLDGTVVTIVLPIMQQELHATIVGAQWIVEIYLLFLSSLILVGGAVGDRVGRERVFTGGVIVFGIASIGCALSSTLGVLIIWRAIQGIASAFLIPESLAILGAAFTPGERGRAIGTWSSATAIVMAGGPIVGGWLAQHTSWRWIFALNVPLAVAVVAIMWFEVPFSNPPKATRALDWIGASLITVGLGGIVFGLIESPQYGLGSLRVVLSLIIGVALIGAFVVVEDRVIRPLVPLMLFRSRAFSGANLITLLLYAALGGALFFLPFNLIQIHHYSAAAAGAAMLPLIILMALLSRFSGELADRIGITLPLTIGPLLSGLGIASFALPGASGSYWVTFFPGMVILGLGLAVTVAPLTTAVLSAVDDEFEGVASGVNNAVARLGNLLAIGVLGIIMVQRFSTQLDTALAHAGAPAQVRQALSAQALQLSAIKAPPGYEHIVTLAAVSAFRAAMIVSAALALVAAGLGATTLPPRRQTSVPTRGRR